MAKSEGPVVIKKYANWRLYHPGTSTYVPLDDPAGMARNGDDFIVYDARNRADITASVLIQVASVAGPAGGPSRLH